MDTNTEPKPTIVLIDGYNIMYRAFHGNKYGMQTKSGIPTNAIYTTLNMVRNLYRKIQIDNACVVFDGGKNFRHELVDDYKANRASMPDDLRTQVPHIKDGLEVLGWPQLQSVAEEADDLIASIAIDKAAQGYQVYIISGDKDFRQIVSDNITIVDTMYDIYYTPAVVLEKMGVTPAQVGGYLAILGDSSDNIKGIDKVGKKTAATLMNTYGTTDNLIANADKVGGKVGENLRAAIANNQLQTSISLVNLKTDLNLDYSQYDFCLKEVDPLKLDLFIDKFEFFSWRKTPGHAPR